MSNANNHQQELIQWFNRTYQKRGIKYLRPPEAYAVFPAILKVEPGKKLFDLACGAGLLLKQAINKGLYAYGLDISSTAVELARELVPEAEIYTGTAEQLPYDDHFFDYVTCIGSLERFINREKALQEIKRVTTVDGQICIMVRNSKTLTWKIFRQWPGNINVTAGMDAKGLEEWRKLFKSAGFTVLAVYADQWPKQRWLKWMNGKKKVDFEKIRKPFLPLSLCNEFIIHLRNA
ncbi:MAG: methyltransferase domain-containing protein [Bacteroidetes bacterium]|jgi:ubiquinone/menaquinone biosynthesis C-methylase UbiE|nr:methyltransferase domain-containing protein [Bacteroidota bacterium]